MGVLLTDSLLNRGHKKQLTYKLSCYPGAYLQDIEDKVLAMGADRLKKLPFIAFEAGTNNLHRYVLGVYGPRIRDHRKWTPEPGEVVLEVDAQHRLAELLGTVRILAPNIPIYFMGIPPRPWDLDQSEEPRKRFNTWVKRTLDIHNQAAPATYIDPDVWCLGPDGTPRRHMFYGGRGDKNDGIHLTQAGCYHILRKLRKILPGPAASPRQKRMAWNTSKKCWALQKDITPRCKRPAFTKANVALPPTKRQLERRHAAEERRARRSLGFGRPT